MAAAHSRDGQGVGLGVGEGVEEADRLDIEVVDSKDASGPDSAHTSDASYPGGPVACNTDATVVVNAAEAGAYWVAAAAVVGFEALVEAVAVNVSASATLELESADVEHGVDGHAFQSVAVIVIFDSVLGPDQKTLSLFARISLVGLPLVDRVDGSADLVDGLAPVVVDAAMKLVAYVVAVGPSVCPFLAVEAVALVEETTPNLSPL